MRRPKRKPKHGTYSEYCNHGCRCQPCKNAYSAWSQRNLRETGRGRLAARKRALCEFITEEQCIGLFNSQGGRCAICRKNLTWPSKDAHVDHNHLTGMIRGILCSMCNRGIGNFKDNPEYLRTGADYLEKATRAQERQC